MKSLLYVAVALIAIYALGNSRAVAQDTDKNYLGDSLILRELIKSDVAETAA